MSNSDWQQARSAAWRLGAWDREQHPERWEHLGEPEPTLAVNLLALGLYRTAYSRDVTVADVTLLDVARLLQVQNADELLNQTPHDIDTEVWQFLTSAASGGSAIWSTWCQYAAEVLTNHDSAVRSDHGTTVGDRLTVCPSVT